MCGVLRRENSIDFLSFRLWIGVWVAFNLLVVVALDLSSLVRYLTRFTEESFAVLISVIFIYESFVNIADIWTTHPVRTVVGTSATDEPCYCSLHAVRDGQITATYHGVEDNRIKRSARVTVVLNETRFNNSFYR